ncbi:MAG: dipeptidyl-peptidase 4 [Fimbriimonadaceae bacterium]|jgi:dipeptidyl-peptidase-4|nr:dipeptidyl-peptidase 4 [Fimbriimonadaceae bacterium]
MVRLRALIGAAFLAVACLINAQDLPKSDLSIERLYSYPLVQGRSPTGAAMAPGGKHIVFGWNQTGDRRLDVWLMDFPSGKKRQVISASAIEWLPRQDDERTDEEKKDEEVYDPGVAGFSWAPDGKEFLFSYRGRIWTSDLEGKDLAPLMDAGAGQRNASYSPDGRYIAFLQGQNLFRFDRHTGRIKQLTFLSKAKTKIESVSGTDDYAWAPDGTHIALAWSDSSKTGSHVMMDFTKDRAKTVDIDREWVGETPNNVQFGVVGVDGGLIKFVDGLPRYLWASGLKWSPDGSMLAIGWMKEDFQEYTISTVPVSTMKKLDVYTEKAPSNYIPDFRPLVWSRDNKWIIFGTDILDGKFGYRSILRVDPFGKNISKVFAENYDVTSLSRPKDSDRLFLTTMSRSPLQSEITILEPDEKRTTHVVVENGASTPNNYDASASPLVSDDGKRVATLASTRTMNAELFEVEPQIKRLTKSQLPVFDKIKWAEYKEVTFNAPDGKTLHALLIQRPGLSTSMQRPAVISNLYANSAKESWGGHLENYLAMQLGFVVLQVDLRGSWGYGGEFNSGYAKSLGVIDADELVAAKSYLASLGYVRPDRVGLFGWSYGGFLTCMAMFTKPGVFDTGVAVASVTDWANYNEWYSRRRLGMPKDNAEIYKKTSPIYHTAGLQGNLLLVHGMLDDNVLYADTARLFQKLIENGKYFDSMSYPHDNHSIGRAESRPHVYATIARYLYFKLNRP